MDDIGIPAEEFAHPIDKEDQDKDHEEDEQVLVGEERDELRHGFIGLDTLQHPALMDPTEKALFVGKLHPHGVDGVVGDDADVGYGKPFVGLHGEGIRGQVAHRLFRHLQGEDQRVGRHHEIVVMGIMMRPGKDDGVDLLGRQRIVGRTVHGDGFVIASGGYQHQAQPSQQGPNSLHRHSSDNVDNQTAVGSDGGRATADKAVHASRVSGDLPSCKNPTGDVCNAGTA